MVVEEIQKQAFALYTGCLAAAGPLRVAHSRQRELSSNTHHMRAALADLSQSIANARLDGEQELQQIIDQAALDAGSCSSSAEQLMSLPVPPAGATVLPPNTTTAATAAATTTGAANTRTFTENHSEDRLSEHSNRLKEDSQNDVQLRRAPSSRREPTTAAHHHEDRLAPTTAGYRHDDRAQPGPDYALHEEQQQPQQLQQSHAEKQKQHDSVHLEPLHRAPEQQPQQHPAVENDAQSTSNSSSSHSGELRRGHFPHSPSRGRSNRINAATLVNSTTQASRFSAVLALRHGATARPVSVNITSV